MEVIGKEVIFFEGKEVMEEEGVVVVAEEAETMLINYSLVCLNLFFDLVTRSK